MPYKYCVVPMCPNTTVKTPSKLFFAVPHDAKRRKKWMSVMKRAVPIGPKTCAFCCEDHFDIENDMENYVKYKLVGGLLKLKIDACPHKFSCQKQITEKVERSVERKRKIQELLHRFHHEDIPTTSEDIEEIYIVDPAQDSNAAPDPDPLKSEPDEVEKISVNKSKTKHKKVQVCFKTKTHDKSTMTTEKYFTKPATKRTISKRKLGKKINENTCSISSSTTSKESAVASDVNDADTADLDKIVFKNKMAKFALLCISREPQLLLGLPKQCYYCIELLSAHGKCTHRDVMITLKKIRLHQSNALLALDFGLSSGSVETIFRQTVPAIASCMASVIFFPNPSDVLINLPITFRSRYSNVQSIIECLEIQIEEPSNAVQQALTWSEDKSCNTIKYLISITPDGLINYISEGYGGRTSDELIFEDSGILHKLPKNAAVLADRGFKNIAHLLQRQGNILIRPPCVSTKVAPTKSEALETKRIAALRIHVERTIERLRNFGILMPNACIDLKQVDILDLIMVIACGIVNLQNPLRWKE